jgi:hypothetical protein
MRNAAVLTLLIIGSSRLAAQVPASGAPVASLYARSALRIPATADDGTPVYGTAAWATRLAGGEVVIADGADLKVRIFGTDGREVRAFGRDGRGPGEFSSLGWVGTCGSDSLFAWDYVAARMTVLDPTRGRVRDWTNPAIGGPQATQCSARREWTFVTRLSRTEQSQPVLNTITASGFRYRFWSDTLDVAVVDETGREVRTLVDQAYRESIAVNFPDGRFMAGQRLFGLATFADWVGDTIVLVSNVDGAVRFAPTITAGASRFRAGDPGRHQPTSVDRDAAVEALIHRSPSRLADYYRTVGRELPMPEFLPAVHSLTTSRDGRVWVVISTPGSRTTELVAYATSGRVVARLSLPEPLVLFEVGDHHLLGRAENEEGEQEVVLYQFARP